MSYRITLDGELFCSSETDELAIIDPEITLKANNAGTFTFTLAPTHPFYDLIELKTSIIEVIRNGESIFEGFPTSEGLDFYKNKTVTCEGVLSFLNDSILRQSYRQGKTAQQLFTEYVTEHNAQVDGWKEFAVGTVTVNDDYITCYTNYNSTMQEIKEDLLDDLGGYLRARKDEGVRYLDYLAGSPRTSDQVIRIGKNLLDLSQNFDASDICTRVIPLGAKLDEQEVPGLDAYVTVKSVTAGNVDYIDSEQAEEIGIVSKVVTWDKITTPAALKQKAEAWLTDAQFAKMTITATAFDLSLTSSQMEALRVLDNVRVISEPHGMDRFFMITELTIHLDDPGADTITMGSDERATITAKTVKANADTKKIEKDSVTRGMIASAVAEATALITGEDGGHIKIKRDPVTGVPEQILIMDTNDESTATKIWRWNLSGLGYSSDGGQTYGLAITKEGEIVADYMSVGILRSRESNSPKFYLDLDNGVLKANFAELSISGLAAATQSYADGKASAAQSAAEVTAAADATSKANAAQSAAESYADSAISTYNTGLDQTAVFNKLTNNGALQGLFMLNNELYMNCTYLNGGVITGQEINNGSGTFTVDAAGNVVANSFSSNNVNITGGAINMTGASGWSAITLQLENDPDTWVRMTPVGVFTSYSMLNRSSTLDGNGLGVYELVAGMEHERLSLIDDGLFFTDVNGKYTAYYPADASYGFAYLGMATSSASYNAVSISNIQRYRAFALCTLRGGAGVNKGVMATTIIPQEIAKVCNGDTSCSWVYCAQNGAYHGQCYFDFSNGYAYLKGSADADSNLRLYGIF